MSNEYNDYDYVDPEMKEFASKHKTKLIFGAVALLLSWPIIIFLCCL